MFEPQYIIIIFILTLTVYIFRKKRPKKYPPGPVSLPILGSLHHLGLEPHKAFMKLSETYGNIFSIDLASYPAIVLNDYESIKEAFNNDAFSGRPRLRPFVERCDDGVLRGIITNDGKNWVEQRGFILRTLMEFGFGKSSMEILIQQKLEELIEVLHSEIGKPIDIAHKFPGPIINSLWHILTGERFAYDDPKFKSILYSIVEEKKISTAYGFRIMNFRTRCNRDQLLDLQPYLIRSSKESKFRGVFYFFPTLTKFFPQLTGYNQAMNVMTGGFDIIEETIKRHKDTFQDGVPRDLIDAYLQEIMNTKDTESSFYKKEGECNLKIVFCDLLMAGIETTSNILTWVFSILAQENEEQEKLFNEIKQVIGLSRQPVLKDRECMPYTEAIIMEVMRFASIAPLSVFHNTMRDVNFKGYFIPKNTLIISNLYAVLRDTKIWGDPNIFRPDRFILPNGKLNRHHYGNIPFSIGKRICPGETVAKEELFLFVTTLFQKFQVSNDPSQPIPSLNESICGLAFTPKSHALILQER